LVGSAHFKRHPVSPPSQWAYFNKLFPRRTAPHFSRVPCGAFVPFISSAAKGQLCMPQMRLLFFFLLTAQLLFFRDHILASNFFFSYLHFPFFFYTKRCAQSPFFPQYPPPFSPPSAIMSSGSAIDPRRLKLLGYVYELRPTFLFSFESAPFFFFPSLASRAGGWGDYGSPFFFSEILQ